MHPEECEDNKLTKKTELQDQRETEWMNGISDEAKMDRPRPAFKVGANRQAGRVDRKKKMRVSFA